LRARRDRGVTLIATVLLSVIAATIALVIVQQTVLAARAEAVRTHFDTAYAKALDVKAAFERDLLSDPSFFTTHLFRYERPRLCVRDGHVEPVIPPMNPEKVDPSDPLAPQNTQWPQGCPSTWDYLAAGYSAVDPDTGAYYDPADHPVRAEIRPPSTKNPRLILRVLSSHGTAETGITVTYRPSSAAGMTVYSGGDLRLDTVNGADVSLPQAAVSVQGSVYAAGKLHLPTRAADLTGAQLFTEAGFVGALPDEGTYYHRSDPARPSVGDIRQVLPAPLNMDGLRSTYTRLEAVGCSGEAAVNHSDSDTTSTLCLRPGQVLRPADGSAPAHDITVPDGDNAPRAYLLTFDTKDQTPVVTVHTSTTPPSQVADCALRCDLSSMARADYTAGTHPAASPFTTPAATPWRLLGQFRYPASGVVVTSADTYIGICPGSIDPAAPCTATEPQRSLTVVAGSPRHPADVILSGSLVHDDNVSVGLVATGSLVVPHYARTPREGDLRVEANLVALGYGLTSGESGLQAFPARQGAWAANENNYGNTFQVTGSVATPSLTADLPGWRHVRVVPDLASVATPPPYFPGFTTGWVAQGMTSLAPHDVCQDANCSQVW